MISVDEKSTGTNLIDLMSAEKIPGTFFVDEICTVPVHFSSCFVVVIINYVREWRRPKPKGSEAMPRALPSHRPSSLFMTKHNKTLIKIYYIIPERTCSLYVDVKNKSERF